MQLYEFGRSHITQLWYMDHKPIGDQGGVCRRMKIRSSGNACLAMGHKDMQG